MSQSWSCNRMPLATEAYYDETVKCSNTVAVAVVVVAAADVTHAC